MHRTNLFRLAILFFLIIFASIVNAQQKFNYQFNQTPLSEVLAKIESDANIRFYYLNDWIEGRVITGTFSSTTIEGLINKVLKDTGFSFEKYDQTSYALINNIRDGQIIETVASNGDRLKKVVIGNLDTKFTNERARISGTVIDAETQQPIVGATLFIEKLKKGVVSDTEGNYSLELPVGEHTINAKSVGYHEDFLNVILRSDGVFDILLVSSTNTLDEVTILGKAENEIVSEAQMSVEKIEMKDIEYVPALMGERDIVKAIALKPGVVSGEATNGYSVRGSNLGQNLIFIDGAPVYNSSHLFGLFSIFNPGVVQSSTIYKGTMPAQYGGRVASVMNVNVKDGKNEKLEGEAGIGLISSRLHLAGPLAKNLGFVIGGRASYINRYLKRIENSDIRDSRGAFYDINAKLTFSNSESNSYQLNTLLSKDDFTLPNGDRIEYNSKIGSVKWAHKITETSINNLTIAFSDYRSEIKTSDTLLNKTIQNGVQTFLIKSNLSSFKFEKHALNFGLEANFTSVDPGKVAEQKAGGVSFEQIQKQKALESAFFASDEFKLTDRLTINVGLRYSNFTLIGAGTEYNYLPGEPKQSSTVLDSTVYSNGKIMKSYSGLEPRFFAKYDLKHDIELKFNIGRSYQYIHLISNSASISPLSIWKLSDSHLKPQIADQGSLGIFKEFNNKPIEIGAEVYFRRILNLPDYKNGANLANNPNLETELISGQGYAYGVEFQIAKKTGKLSGLLSYTYSRSLNQMDSDIDEEKINKGEIYNSDYDIPQNISITGDYLISRNWSISFNWLFSTGRPVSYPSAIYYQNGSAVMYFNKRNQYRIPDYHRLDLSLNWKTPNLEVDKKWDLSWSFSLYNVYGRNNAYSVFFQRSDNLPLAKKLSILAQPIPSVTMIIKLL